MTFCSSSVSFAGSSRAAYSYVCVSLEILNLHHLSLGTVSVESVSLFIYFLNIYLFWLRQVLVSAHGILAAACGFLSCGTQNS